MSATGPESIDMHAVAAAFSEAVGRAVRYAPIPVTALDQGMAQMGMDEFTRTMLCDYFTAYSNNWGDVVTHTVPQLLGRPARSIRDFARAVAGPSAQARASRSPSRIGRAVARWQVGCRSSRPRLGV